MKQSLPLFIAAAAVVLLLVLLSSSGKKPPAIPRDPVHTGMRTHDGCPSCHAPGMQSPLKDTHPPKEQCLVCHLPAP